jgi:hypothetical protein
MYKQYTFNCNILEKAIYLDHAFRTGMVTSPTSSDPSKLSNVPGYAPARLGLGRFGCAPKGPIKASYIICEAQAQPL